MFEDGDLLLSEAIDVSKQLRRRTASKQAIRQYQKLVSRHHLRSQFPDQVPKESNLDPGTKTQRW
jgi:hypothetical protein